MTFDFFRRASTAFDEKQKSRPMVLHQRATENRCTTFVRRFASKPTSLSRLRDQPPRATFVKDAVSPHGTSKLHRTTFSAEFSPQSALSEKKFFDRPFAECACVQNVNKHITKILPHNRRFCKRFGAIVQTVATIVLRNAFCKKIFFCNANKPIAARKRPRRSGKANNQHSLPQQIIRRNVKKIAQSHHIRSLRLVHSTLPVVYSFLTDADLIAELLLRNIFFFS